MKRRFTRPSYSNWKLLIDRALYRADQADIDDQPLEVVDDLRDMYDVGETATKAAKVIINRAKQ